MVFVILNLPMLAFRMTGMDELIELTIDEVWGFPNVTSYGGGYGAKGMLSIRAGAYAVSAEHCFTTGELYTFFIALKQGYNTLSGEAVLENTERELELQCVFNKRGQVIVSGRFQADPSINNVLSFEIKTDQTQVKDSISSLQAIYEVFGDHQGKRGYKDRRISHV